jgi:hypothetical protein
MFCFQNLYVLFPIIPVNFINKILLKILLTILKLLNIKRFLINLYSISLLISLNITKDGFYYNKVYNHYLIIEKKKKLDGNTKKKVINE